MAVYVDDAGIVWRGKKRYHLTADSLAELHAFTARIRVNRCWLHPGSRYPHYDIKGAQRADALGAGAKAVTSKELVVVAKKLWVPPAAAKMKPRNQLSLEFLCPANSTTSTKSQSEPPKVIAET